MAPPDPVAMFARKSTCPSNTMFAPGLPRIAKGQTFCASGGGQAGSLILEASLTDSPCDNVPKHPHFAFTELIQSFRRSRKQRSTVVSPAPAGAFPSECAHPFKEIQGLDWRNGGPSQELFVLRERMARVLRRLEDSPVYKTSPVHQGTIVLHVQVAPEHRFSIVQQRSCVIPPVDDQQGKFFVKSMKMQSSVRHHARLVT